jgi:hypothetical protein
MIKLDIIKVFSRKAFFKIFFYLIFLGALVYLALFYGVSLLTQTLPEIQNSSGGQMAPAGAADLLMLMKRHMISFVLPAVSLVFLLVALGLWMGLCRSFKQLLATSGTTPRPKSTRHKMEPVEDKAQKRRYDKQMFLYLLSLLQREGRLIDFLTEDLSLYEDVQIGAAVRGIHENCKKVIEKNLSPKPVLDSPEGEYVTVEAGFNPGAIKLIGNVSGEPPFKGILRHRGWQSKKEELPTLSGTQDAGILSPAEVEIQ